MSKRIQHNEITWQHIKEMKKHFDEMPLPVFDPCEAAFKYCEWKVCNDVLEVWLKRKPALIEVDTVHKNIVAGSWIVYNGRVLGKLTRNFVYGAPMVNVSFDPVDNIIAEKIYKQH